MTVRLSNRRSARHGWAVAPLFCLAASGAWAQPKAIVVDIAGPCRLVLDGHPVTCAGVAYMAFPDTHRIDFAAVTQKAGWVFSGQQDANDEGQYSLAVDRVISPQSGPERAQGQCDMAIESDGRTVSSLTCKAMTPAGALTLDASGRVIGVTGAGGADNGDNDDGDDDDDSGDSAQG